MIKIYAIRDRLIDYFMQPFVGPDDKNVLASVARLVNQGEITSDIAQAPHHFEVWKLGEVAEDGTLVPEKQYLQDCSSLVRPGLRERDKPRSPEDGPTAEIGRGTTPGAYPANGAAQRPAQAAPPPTEDQASQLRKTPNGAPPRTNQHLSPTDYDV